MVIFHARSLLVYNLDEILAILVKCLRLGSFGAGLVFTALGGALCYKRRSGAPLILALGFLSHIMTFEQVGHLLLVDFEE